MIYRTVYLCLILLIGVSTSTFAAVPYKIGISLSLTGKFTQMGHMQLKGFRLWEDIINDKGGLLGTPVQLIIEDDQSNAQKAVRIYEDHIVNKRVDFILGPYSSSISEAILPIAEHHQYPVLLSGASADRLWNKGYRYAFGVYAPASKYTIGFLQMLVKHRLHRLAIVSARDAFSFSLSENTKKWADRFGLDVIYSTHLADGTTGFSPLIHEMKRLDPDVIIICGHLEESIAARTALKTANWYPKAFYASVGPAMDKYNVRLKADANHTFSSSHWEMDTSQHYPFGTQFVDQFYKTFGIHPSYHAATAFAAGMILEQAVCNSNSINKEKIRDQLSTMNTMTIIGRYGVNAVGKQSRHVPLIIQWQDGLKKVVWPEQIKLAEPIFTK